MANMTSEQISILAIDVGNSRIAACVSDGAVCGEPAYAPTSDVPAAADMIVELAHGLDGVVTAAVVLSSVNNEASSALKEALRGRLTGDVLELGEDLPIPLTHTLGESHTTGRDRFLNALAAFDSAQQACVVVDAGTAITVDFIDGQGVYHGGAIAPGASMQLRSLHEQTGSLPDIDLARPDAGEPFAKTTEQAMLQGVCVGARGMVRALAEQYAESYGGYPLIIATGGDAELLFTDDELIERIIPDLTLRGLILAGRLAIKGQDADALSP